ncbi:hypothetical protein ZWY2020_059769 [Hordeum vulgare]|nr:hypothetical protein ZWY2020_059769 [Hordeum vulgare]
MDASPRSVTSSFPHHNEHPVVSGLGLSSCSRGSEASGPALPASATAQPEATWRQPRPTRRERWRLCHGLGEQGAQVPPAPRPVHEISLEMHGPFFRCFEEGHDYTNEMVCFCCGVSGHSSKECKRPRSP